MSRKAAASPKIVADLVSSQDLAAVAPTATAFDASVLMDDRNIGAVLVLENGRLVGVLSERDVVRRVVVQGRDPKKTPVAEVMTAQPRTVTPATEVGRALWQMYEAGVRHLPVVEAGSVVAVLSLRDFTGADLDRARKEFSRRTDLEHSLGW